MSAPIWFGQPTIDLISQMQQGTIDEHLGISITEIGPDYLKGTMPVDRRTLQPTGRLHGGANVVLAESLGSIGANMVVDNSQRVCFGLDINANHVRGVSQGEVTGIAKPLHIGATTQVWEIKIYDEKDRLSCISRLTMAVVKR
ncbi:hotdog fold thioesterase [Halioxenophilus aromaticivorans]|uniref:Hotdog fold thioesterase n=1 Tax=Halioxenophilus aromaticivorans TaxID=1306992 RepID=A0AAV3U1X6_9ALTE